jgi:hypothetical protein
MLTFLMNPRDGGSAVSSCSTSCCCEQLQLKPGETNRILLDYSAWALPIGDIVETTQFHIEEDNSTCATDPIDGFLPPTNSPRLATVAVNTAAVISLATGQLPAGNTFVYRVVPLSGPERGTVSIAGGVATYTPNTGFQGYDYFIYEVEDAQGRTVRYPVQVNVGVHNELPVAGAMSLVPYVDRRAVTVNNNMKTVGFPVHMPLTVAPCQKFTLHVKQPARDCDTVYHHLSCFNISSKDC